LFCDRAKNSLCVLAQKRSVEMKISGKELMLGRKSKQTVLFVVVKRKKLATILLLCCSISAE